MLPLESRETTKGVALPTDVDVGVMSQRRCVQMDKRRRQLSCAIGWSDGQTDSEFGLATRKTYWKTELRNDLLEV